MTSASGSAILKEEELVFIESSEAAAAVAAELTAERADRDSQPANAAASTFAMKLPANLQAGMPLPAVKAWLSRRRQEIRPWSAFANTANFQLPSPSLPRISKRVYRNVEYFQSNYVFVFLILFIFCLLTSPLLLIVIAASGGACYIAAIRQAEQKLVLAGREISLGQQYAAIGVASLPMFALAGAGSAVFWVIGASFFFVGLHAAFYNFDALDIQDESQQLTGTIVEEV